VVYRLEALDALIRNGKILVVSQAQIDQLMQRGYGVLTDDKELQLQPYEALYLLSDQKLKIKGDSGVEIGLDELVHLYQKSDPNLWVRFLIYRDLRSRGYVVREGFGFGLDFRVYERGEYGSQEAKYIVFGISEGLPVPVGKTLEVLKFVQGLKREMVLAVIDRRGEVVYYSVSKLNLK
jgi:tRNA-intron endonuclease